MINKGFIKVLLIILVCFSMLFYFGHSGIAAQTRDIELQDTIKTNTLDTAKISKKDTLKTKNDIEDIVKYSARDSQSIDAENKILRLYGDAKISYQNIELTASYVEFDMTSQTVYASATEDSLGTIVGVPHFKEGSEEFDAHWLRYNFKTKKGFVYFVKTKQSEGTLIGDSTKRNPNGHIHLKGAKYSTCDLDHPHFYMSLTKAKSVPNDKIISGPAYLVVADIPLPLFLPFGYFPNTKGFSSGLLLPTWGQERTRGFYINRGGYYFAISDNLDGQITGDLYSKGSWAANLQANYKVRYKYNGRLNFNYNNNVYSEKGMPDYNVTKDYRFSWNHTQDPKANPNSTFSANVNLSSTSYDKNNSYNASDFLTNTKSSSISYSKRWPNAPFNFTASLNHSQNSLSNTAINPQPNISMTLPNMAVSMNPVYPFRKEESSGEPIWYENIQFTYNASLENRVATYDSLFLTNRMFDNLQNGFKHSVPLSTNFKITRFINLTPSISYNGVMYTKKTTYSNNASGGIDTTVHHGLVYAHSLTPSVSLGYNPKLYGMFMFRNSKIKAIRHVMSPYASLGFTPDISDFVPNYYGTYQLADGKTTKPYSYFDGQIYGTPTPPPGKSASINFGLRNNLEMKYLSTSDTSSKDEKLSLLENLDFSGSYNLMADSFNMSNISMSTGTRLFSDKFNIRFDASFDPYAMDTAGKRLKDYSIIKYRKLARMESASVSIGTSFRSGEGKGKPTSGDNRNTSIDRPTNLGLANDFDNEVINYDIPWSISINYQWSYSKPQLESTITQTLSFSGDLSLTKKWKIGYSSGYDFNLNTISYTRINISRDLHCWEMRFDWVPLGSHSNYNFTINARGLLQDLKYNKKKDWRDN